MKHLKTVSCFFATKHEALARKATLRGSDPFRAGSRMPLCHRQPAPKSPHGPFEFFASMGKLREKFPSFRVVSAGGKLTLPLLPS